MKHLRMLALCGLFFVSQLAYATGCPGGYYTNLRCANKCQLDFINCKIMHPLEYVHCQALYNACTPTCQRCAASTDPLAFRDGDADPLVSPVRIQASLIACQEENAEVRVGARAAP